MSYPTRKIIYTVMALVITFSGFMCANGVYNPWGYIFVYGILPTYIFGFYIYDPDDGSDY